MPRACSTLLFLLFALGALWPTGSRAFGLEGSVGAALGSGPQARILGEIALALDPQILLGARLEAGLEKRRGRPTEGLGRALLGVHWRFDRSRTLFRLAGLFGFEVLGESFGSALLLAELGVDRWPTPLSGIAYGLTLTYELRPATQEMAVLIGVRLRYGGK